MIRSKNRLDKQRQQVDNQLFEYLRPRVASSLYPFVKYLIVETLTHSLENPLREQMVGNIGIPLKEAIARK